MSEKKFDLRLGKSEEVLRDFPDDYFDSVVTDPPYHLTSIVKRFGKGDSAPAQFGIDGAYSRASRGFMGQEWDGGDIAFQPSFWAEVIRVLKPGGHIVAFSGSRTYHRMACAIEDAGFEIRDQIMWLYGSGFPKSHNVGKSIDKMAGAEREIISEKENRSSFDKDGQGGGGFQRGTIIETLPATEAARQWQGWGSALKPAHEPIFLARKPLIGSIAANVLQHGTGALNIDGCRIETDELAGKVYNNQNTGWACQSAPSVVQGNDAGRWPANIIHDGSEEVVSSFPDSSPGSGGVKKFNIDKNSLVSFGNDFLPFTPKDDAGIGSAARFFYCAKASKQDRDEGVPQIFEQQKAATLGDLGAVEGNPKKPKTDHVQKLRNHHPTVKPTSLMRYLCRLITPPGGIVLDPFMGSGSTGKAAVLENMAFVGIDMTPEYLEIARHRIAYAACEPVETKAEKSEISKGQIDLFTR